jgi:predicted AAA+ superfamily ATPase
MPTLTYERAQAAVLRQRLGEPRRFLQVVAGPRQIGKSTMVQQVLASVAADEGDRARTIYASADEPALRDRAWLVAQGQRARLAAQTAASSQTRGASRSRSRRSGGSQRSQVGAARCVLALDEIQKVPGWAETVKSLWDEDTREGSALHVVLSGSAPWLVAQGLGESLAGRFEVLHLGHWTWPEMRDAFGFEMEHYLWFGGYPGAAALVNDEERWRRYVLDALVETTIARDVLLMTRVDKPALMRRLFDLGCRYSGQILSYTKMLGQLQDAGNATTLAHYLDLLAGAGMLCGISKYAGEHVRRRGSIPKLQVFNTALMAAQSDVLDGDRRQDPQVRGRWIESVVGAHLVNAAAAGECEVFYWRDRNREVDFVVRCGSHLLALEVKSARSPTSLPGLAAFEQAFHPRRTLLVGADGVPLEEFLSYPVRHWAGG